jgi:hypothetical protein
MILQKYSLNILQVLIVCYLISVNISCNHPNAKKNIDASNIKINYQAIRFDRLLFACDTNDIAESVNQLGNLHPDFASVYFNEMTGFSKGNDTTLFNQSVRHFLTYKDYKGLNDTVQKHFPDTKDIDKQLEEVFKHIQYYFPKEKYGTVYYFLSGLNSWSAVTIDTLVGVGLDMFLGANYPFYNSVQLPAYQIERCEKEYIPVNVSKAIYENIVPFDATGKTLLDLMISKGKQQVFAEYTNPSIKDEILIGYQSAQLKWVQDNEAMVWNYFAEKKLLYSTQWQEMMRYVTDGPTSTGMPAESPGNIGTFIGWQIVRKYIENHPEEKLADILTSKTDSQSFLIESGYKPR